MSFNGLQQVQSQTQSMVLAPQLRQSLKILQVSTLDLLHTIRSELETNPTLEELPMEGPSIEESRDDPPGEGESPDAPIDLDENFEILNRLDEDWREFYAQDNCQSAYSPEREESRKHFFDSLPATTSLPESLMEQVALLDLSTDERTALETLIGNLNDHGFLTVTLAEAEEWCGVSQEVMECAYQALIGMEPTGIGARDLPESLLIQLRARGREHSLAATLIRDHFELLLRRRIPELARKTSQRPEAVEAALEEIAGLDPAPGRHFAEDNNRTVLPDVLIEKNDQGEWTVTLNHEFVPRLRLSNHYKELIADGKLSRHDREYLREKMRSGRFLISSIEQRLQTIEKITREIIRFQRDFFEEGLKGLKPLTMSQVAREIGVHETTVSRAIANKYAETPHGVFELRYFFTSGYQGEGGESVANTTIKDRIQDIIHAEDPAKPISDQEIARRLQQENITIARRTVAKYREELNILPTHLRRRYR